MKIKVLTKPYEVTDTLGLKDERLYMSKVEVVDSKGTTNSIVAYHPSTKSYLLFKTDSDMDQLKDSFSFTNNINEYVITDFLKIHDREITQGSSSKHWVHIKF